MLTCDSFHLIRSHMWWSLVLIPYSTQTSVVTSWTQCFFHVYAELIRHDPVRSRYPQRHAYCPDTEKTLLLCNIITNWNFGKKLKTYLIVLSFSFYFPPQGFIKSFLAAIIHPSNKHWLIVKGSVSSRQVWPSKDSTAAKTTLLCRDRGVIFQGSRLSGISIQQT